MQVSVETLNGLERKVTVSVPTGKVEEEVSLRLKDLARRVKIDGFRPGKAPANLVKQRFSDSVRQDVAREMVQSTLFDALKEKELVPAGYPSIEPGAIAAGEDFTYAATFEVFPEFQINELEQAEVEVLSAQVEDSDVENMLNKLREQNKAWQEVSRKVANGDKVNIDFEGFLNGEAFEGGAAQGHELVIGSGAMIPGFEDGLIGAEVGKAFDLPVRFPEAYGSAELAGKEAVFKITVNQVMEGKLPELDDAFAEQFNLKEKGLDALKKDIRDNMERELERRVSGINREKAFDKLMETNQFDLPSTLINQEIEHLKHELFHRIFGAEHREDEKIPDFPRSLFEEQAKRRVHLGLLFSEYVKKHDIKADEARTNAMIEKFATAYEDPEELRNWYKNSKERMADIEALILEEMVAEKILESAKKLNKSVDYDHVMTEKNAQEDTGE